jgi:branched-chain amino acid transport system ATP-binding protein
VFAGLTVRENLMVGAYLRRDKPDIRADFQKVFELFPILKQRASQAAGSLSGGEQAMLAIGRALMARPRLLILDEPSLGLAPLIVARIFELLAEINARGVTILLVEQNAVMALDLSHRAYVLETGRIILSGPSKAVACDEAVRRAYLGGK